MNTSIVHEPEMYPHKLLQLQHHWYNSKEICHDMNQLLLLNGKSKTAHVFLITSTFYMHCHDDIEHPVAECSATGLFQHMLKLL